MRIPIRLLAWPAAAAALLSAAPALAEDWQVLTTSKEGIVFWIDRDSIQTVEGYPQAWTKSDYSAVETGDVSERKALEDYDCAARALRLRRTIAYGRDGNVLRTLNQTASEAKWSPVQEGSIGDAKIAEVCGG
ncbi:surface-adhesin E family protein [Sphingomonas canadensis]|uniref:Surface-adhesin E family protein n=1 Tax=Sphingomonas canadensis TaxID=1219257 RepID=A0ABW3H9W2_9SPHN|nr:surface-adhesin E family protein [Sphingomonas canadensis]MCW3837536.1 hypothetical protein [Sphingomonas canadensis]